jgi:hypothetical protein
MSAHLPPRRPALQTRNPHAQERRRQIRGLLLLAMAAIVFAILRAGAGRAFNPGWWRLW